MKAKCAILMPKRRPLLIPSKFEASRPALLLRADAAAAPTMEDFTKATLLVKELTEKFTAKSDELTKEAAKAFGELKEKGALITETKAAVDKLILEQTTAVGELNKASARMIGIEQELARRPGGAGNGTAAYKSIGGQVAADEKMKTFAADKTRGKYRFEAKAAITSVDLPVIDGTPNVVPPMVVPGTLVQPKQRLFVRDLIPVGQTESPAVFYVRQTGFTNAARPVTEGQKKPESTITYDSKIVGVQTIAHTFKSSKQILDDFKQLRTDIDREMRYGLKYAEEQEVLLGDGEGVHLHGIVPQASAFASAFEVLHHNMIDDLRLAILQSQLARLPATGIVMHFIDWAKVELTKNDSGDYIFANPLRLAGTNLWGLPVVPTEIEEFEGNFLTGAFGGGAQIYDREVINVEIATENNDDFEKNMITGRCEERIALAVFRPEAFIFGPYTNPTE